MLSAHRTSAIRALPGLGGARWGLACPWLPLSPRGCAAMAAPAPLPPEVQELIARALEQQRAELAAIPDRPGKKHNTVFVCMFLFVKKT